MDIDDMASASADELVDAIAPVIAAHLRAAHADRIDEMLDELTTAVSDVADGAQDYADGEADPEDEETTWSAEEVNALIVAAWEAGHQAATDALQSAVDSAKYRGR